MTDRRAVLKLALGLAGGQLARAGGVAAAQPAAPAPAAAPASAQPFDFAWLKGQAHWLAGNAFQPSKDLLPPAMGKLGYDQYQSIRFRADHALWADAGLAFRLQFFHVGRNFTEPVHLYEVLDGQAREIVYDPAMFDWSQSGVDPSIMKDRAGFAGFRIQFITDWRDDVAAFLGASYFRAVARGQGYGLSARGLSIKTADTSGEEFPLFRSFWLERPAPNTDCLIVHALPCPAWRR
jgi:glucans biosynthesis protein